MTRRRFLEIALFGLLILGILICLWGIIRFFMPPPRRKRSGGKILAGSVGELARLGAKKIALDGMPVWLIKRNKDFVAISAICTHAGCVVRYDTIKGLMICPCHGGIFDISGNVLSGPPRDPLRRFRLQFENNLIYILW